jgi:Pretoxin HINT domain
MCFALILAATLGAFADEPPPSPTKPDMAAYNETAAKTPKNAEAQVRLALWCEAHGLTAERLKHLSLAVLYEPKNALARGLMGLVAFQGKWERPEQVSREVQDDAEQKARIKEYLQRRSKAPDRAEDQWKLALWCEQNDLKSQATAHLFRVVQLDPTRETAWKHLGFKRIGGHWDKPERVAAAKAEADQQHKADKHWRPLLEKWREALASRDKIRREQAEKSLADVEDPRSVPMIWVVFVHAGEQYHKAAVQLLGQIDSPGSSRALAFLAIRSRSAEVRRIATQTLRQRDPRDFAPVLIALLRDPIKYEVRRVNGPGSLGQLFIKQKDVNIKRLYSPLSAPYVQMMPGDQIVLDANGLPVVIRNLGGYQARFMSSGGLPPALLPTMFGLSSNQTTPAQVSGVFAQAGLPAGLSQRLGASLSQKGPLGFTDLGGPANGISFTNATIDRQLDIPIGQMAVDAQRSAQAAEQQLGNDVRSIENFNAPIVDMNQRVREVLVDSLGTDQGAEKSDWEKWLVDLAGYAFADSSTSEPPTVIEQVPISYQPQAAPLIVDQAVSVVTIRHACFGAGTLVRTLDGSTEIEKLRGGDLVLTQGPITGELKYQPILIAYHNPPNSTLRIDLGSETLVATGIHRLWKAGRGWVMARELKPGDALRTLGGLAVVKSVEKERVQPVFNLQVADGESFFVGKAGVLAHDNSLVHPNPSPFDAVPDLEKSAAASTTAGHERH